MKLKIFVLALFLGISNSYAQKAFVNPGVKVGYMFGENGGFVWGFEISVLIYNAKQDMLWGIVLDYDIVNNMKRLHIGIEGTRAAIGLDIGPTFVWENDESYTGFSIIPFGGIIIIPYYNFTYLIHKGDFHEIGSYLKISIGDYKFRLQ